MFISPGQMEPSAVIGLGIALIGAIVGACAWEVVMLRPSFGRWQNAYSRYKADHSKTKMVDESEAPVSKSYQHFPAKERHHHYYVRSERSTLPLVRAEDEG